VGIFCDIPVNLQVLDRIGGFPELFIKAKLFDDIDRAMYMNKKVLWGIGCPAVATLILLPLTRSVNLK
jgi:hypothetical protein